MAVPRQRSRRLTFLLLERPPKEKRHGNMGCLNLPPQVYTASLPSELLFFSHASKCRLSMYHASTIYVRPQQLGVRNLGRLPRPGLLPRRRRAISCVQASASSRNSSQESLHRLDFVTCLSRGFSEINRAMPSKIYRRACFQTQPNALRNRQALLQENNVAVIARTLISYRLHLVLSYLSPS